jgi:hypothetical protein
MTADAAQTTSPTEEYVRKEFTIVTLQPRFSHNVLELNSALEVCLNALLGESG